MIELLTNKHCPMQWSLKI